MEASYEFEFRGLEVEGLYNLQSGKYARAEEIFQKYLALMLEFQDRIGRRTHKGNPYHNLGVSQLFQGKIEDALRNIVLAYIEDLVSSDNPVDVDGAPASRVLRGLCGVTWADLRPFEDKVQKLKSVSNIERKPEKIYEQLSKSGNIIIENYQSHLRDTWQFEIKGQLALQSRNFEEAKTIFVTWYEKLKKYQDVRGLRIHKGHPLSYLAFVSVQMDISQGLNYYLCAYIEDVITERKIGDARTTVAFKNLTSGFGFTEEQISRLEEFIRERKKQKADQKSPEKELELFKAGYPIAPTKADAQQIAKPEATAKELKDINDLPGTFQTRVFIGGSHAKEETLREIANYVEECGLTPIIAKDFKSPEEKGQRLLTDHDLDICLIALSRWAIFELSIPGAQFGEIEWAIRFLDKPTFGLRNRGASRLSGHVGSLFQEGPSVDDFFTKRGRPVFEFSRNEEIRKWLREVFKDHCLER